jgi:hypothetical protein
MARPIEQRDPSMSSASAPTELVLIGSSSHSGSTLLDLMLGSHSSVSSAGEMNRLTLFAEDRRCACGAAVARCPYWSRVLARLAATLGRPELHWSDCHTDTPPAAPLVSLDLPESPELVDSGELPAKLASVLSENGVLVPTGSTLRYGGVRDSKWRVVDSSGKDVVVLRREKNRLNVYPGTLTWKNSLRRIPSATDLAVALGMDWSIPMLARSFREAGALFQNAGNSWKVAEAMTAIDGTRFVVDSSKTTVRLKLMYVYRPERARVIWLIRDGRAVVASAMRRLGTTAAVAARVWKRENENLRRALRNIPESRKHQLRYEDLCENPAREISRACDFLGVAFEPGMLRLWERPVHNIPGNPMLFQKSKREIARDERWRRELSAADVETFEDVAGAANRSFGYSSR